jgi:hypothetical protein
VQLLPADRLPPVAARILAAQPQPPRRVSWSDVLEFSWPVLAYLPVPALALAALVLLTNASKGLFLFVVVLAVFTIGIWLRLQILPLVAALQNGRADVGTIVDVAVLPRGGHRGHVRLEHGAGLDLAEFVTLSGQGLVPGDRLKVLVNTASGKVMATLGAAS